MSSTWQLQEAKSRFSELVETVLQVGPQTVTKHGKPAVVIVSAADYHARTPASPSLASALRACPEDLASLLPPRARGRARAVKLG
jgi:antitoxin Phd